MRLKTTEKQSALGAADRGAILQGLPPALADPKLEPRRLRCWMIDYPYLERKPAPRHLPAVRLSLLPVPVARATGAGIWIQRMQRVFGCGYE